MKYSIVLIMLSSALTAFGIVKSGRQQQPEQPQAAQAPSQQKDARPRSGNAETQDALAFTGHVVKEKGRILLKDPVTKMTYQLDDALKAKPFIGKQVRVIGKLDLDSNLIYVDSIGPAL